MPRILGYGEDAFTLWALKHRVKDILKAFQDLTDPLDCLVFYRPSLGRSGGRKSAEFGEFDAIIASSQSVHLIESKWDNLSKFENDEIIVKGEQALRHRIFSWYLTHWNKEYSKRWGAFLKQHQLVFMKEFEGKPIARENRLLALNLEYILSKLREHCRGFSSEQNIKNVLLFFYNEKKSKPPTKVSSPFKLVTFDYSNETLGNFIQLE